VGDLPAGFMLAEGDICAQWPLKELLLKVIWLEEELKLANTCTARQPYHSGLPVRGAGIWAI
jgi:hypothetical protein